MATPRQLWATLERLVNASDRAVSFSELRHQVFDGRAAPILSLIKSDFLGFKLDRIQGWTVTPASPAMGHVFERCLKGVLMVG